MCMIPNFFLSSPIPLTPPGLLAGIPSNSTTIYYLRPSGVPDSVTCLKLPSLHLLLAHLHSKGCVQDVCSYPTHYTTGDGGSSDTSDVDGDTSAGSKVGNSSAEEDTTDCGATKANTTDGGNTKADTPDDDPTNVNTTESTRCHKNQTSSYLTDLKWQMTPTPLTRMTPCTLTTFTICLWFKADFFTRDTTLFSYAISDLDSNVIMIS